MWLNIYWLDSLNLPKTKEDNWMRTTNNNLFEKDHDQEFITDTGANQFRHSLNLEEIK